MNNYRLSTYSDSDVELLTKSERDILVNASPTIKHLSDGRQRDIATGRVVHQHASCIYEIIKPNSNPSDGVIINQTLSEAAQTIGVGSITLSRHLDSEANDNLAQIKGFVVKRIAVFYKKK